MTIQKDNNRTRYSGKKNGRVSVYLAELMGGRPAEKEKQAS